MQAGYSVGDELLLDDRWCVVSQIYRTAMVLYCIKTHQRIIANLDYANKYQTTERCFQKKSSHLYHKGEKILTCTNLLCGERVFYWCLVDGKRELRPAKFVYGRPKDVVLFDSETNESIRLQDVRLVRAYEV